MVSPIIVSYLMELANNVSVNNNDRSKKRYLIVVGIIMFLMIGLRHPSNGSGDTRFYYDFWEKMSSVKLSELKNIIENTDLEVGYQAVTWFLSQFLHNGQWQLIVSGAFFSYTVCSFIYRNCENVVLALMGFNCLGLFNFMVQGLRQAVAMCICLWALEMCKKKHFFGFMLLIAIAMLFHASSFIFITVYFIKDIKLNIKGFFAITAGTVIVLSLLPKAFELANFLMNEHYGTGAGSKEGGIFAIIIYIAVLIFGIAFPNREDNFYPMYVYMLIIATIAMILRIAVNGIIERIAWYFAFSQMAVISNSVSSIKEKRTAFVVCSEVMLLCILVALYKTSYTILIPYRFFWAK